MGTNEPGVRPSRARYATGRNEMTTHRRERRSTHDHGQGHRDGVRKNLTDQTDGENGQRGDAQHDGEIRLRTKEGEETVVSWMVIRERSSCGRGERSKNEERVEERNVQQRQHTEGKGKENGVGRAWRIITEFRRATNR